MWRSSHQTCRQRIRRQGGNRGNQPFNEIKRENHFVSEATQWSVTVNETLKGEEWERNCITTRELFSFPQENKGQGQPIKEKNGFCFRHWNQTTWWLKMIQKMTGWFCMKIEKWWNELRKGWRGLRRGWRRVEKRWTQVDGEKTVRCCEWLRRRNERLGVNRALWNVHNVVISLIIILQMFIHYICLIYNINI